MADFASVQAGQVSWLPPVCEPSAPARQSVSSVPSGAAKASSSAGAGGRCAQPASAMASARSSAVTSRCSGRAELMPVV